MDKFTREAVCLKCGSSQKGCEFKPGKLVVKKGFKLSEEDLVELSKPGSIILCDVSDLKVINEYLVVECLGCGNKRNMLPMDAKE